MTDSLNLASMDALIVEPSPMQTRIIAHACEALGLPPPRHAPNTSDAMAAMLEKIPDVVISALYLPDGSGTELVRQMRAHPLLEQVGFVLVSSETKPQALDPVRQSGICAIVPKPFSEDQLGRALENTLALLNCETLTDTTEPLDELKVLVVDDSPNARHFIQRVLGNLGVEHFIEAGDGAQALAVLQDTLVDLVVTDYNMPEMDGQELVEYIRQRSWQRSVPILMVTSESDQSRLAAVQEAGVSGICDKPFEPDTVRRLLGRMLAGR